MMVRNRRKLLSHGNIEGRRAVLELFEAAFRALDPGMAVRKVVRVSGGKMQVGPLKYDLRKVGRIYVFGAGKATHPMAKVLEETLGERITEGVISIRRQDDGYLRRVEVYRGTHPIPDEEGMKAALRMIEIARGTRLGDLVFTCFTGGVSALLPLPAEGITLEEKRLVTELLLKSGARIQEINAVRKHISSIKGGRLAKVMPKAEIINLTVSDVVGDPLDCNTDPTVIDSSTFSDARTVLKRYRLWSKVPHSVRSRIDRADPREETLKEYGNLKVHSFIVLKNKDACDAMEKRAREMGLNTCVLSTMLEGESRDIGIGLASIAKHAERFGSPARPPCALISAGETTVTIRGNNGRGGPSQELAVSTALKLEDTQSITCGAIDTDGVDGSSDYAGGLCDAYTLSRARALGVDLFEALERHASSEVLAELGDAIMTGPTGTNVMDLTVFVVGVS